MRQNKFGRIINIASAHGLVASPFKAAYVAAKHGIVGLTKVAALETAEQGITCNAICPGYVYTPLVEAQIDGQAKAHNIPRERVIKEQQEALREHDGAWASELDLDTVPNQASVQKFIYPRTSLGAGLFRVRPGPFVPANLTDGAFAQFADAQTLQQLNSYRVTRDIRLAQPGDLLFWTGTYSIQRDPPITHAMIYLGREKKTGMRVMVGASDGRTYQSQQRFGVSVFDFKMPRADNGEIENGKTRPRFVGYAHIPGLRD
jgi:hypothetical protein